MSNDFFEFRTEFFRLRLPIYKVASEVDLHPLAPRSLRCLA